MKVPNAILLAKTKNMNKVKEFFLQKDDEKKERTNS
jgi:hypothetical protein